jgi:hypothetical protein
MPMMITRQLVVSERRSITTLSTLITECQADEECLSFTNWEEDYSLDLFADGKVVHKQLSKGCPFDIKLLYYWHGSKRLQGKDAIHKLENQVRV